MFILFVANSPRSEYPPYYIDDKQKVEKQDDLCAASVPVVAAATAPAGIECVVLAPVAHQERSIFGGFDFNLQLQIVDSLLVHFRVKVFVFEPTGPFLFI